MARIQAHTLFLDGMQGHFVARNRASGEELATGVRRARRAASDSAPKWCGCAVLNNEITYNLHCLTGSRCGRGKQWADLSKFAAARARGASVRHALHDM